MYTLPIENILAQVYNKYIINQESGGIKDMTNSEAFAMIGKRAAELTRKPEVQKKMLQIAKEKSKEEAEKWLYMSAIATLAGI